jgi:carboxypeptidase Q
MTYKAITYAISFIAIMIILTVAKASAQTNNQNDVNTDSLMVRKIYDEGLVHGESYKNLQYVATKIGARLSGSEQELQAIQWATKMLKEIGLDSVYLQKVVVPHWVRGAAEEARIHSSNSIIKLDVLALGGSIGTNGTLKAKVVEVRSWKELAQLKDSDIKGKIVFFNVALDPREIEVFKAYLAVIEYRASGAKEAARWGGAGALIRSLTLSQDDYPHTGTMSYDEKIPKVPAAALSTNSADKLSDLLKKDPELMVELKMNCETLPERVSYNVIGELHGGKYPDEIITVGGHLDSWDIGQGASDNASGMVQSIEAIRLVKTVLVRPERTVRVILYCNEEHGSRGGAMYAAQSKLAGEKNIAAIESDGGGFMPNGFRIDATQPAKNNIWKWSGIFKPYRVSEFVEGQWGVDISHMKHQTQALITLNCDDQRFFDIHHTAADTFEKMSPREIALGSAALASMLALISQHGL